MLKKGRTLISFFLAAFLVLGTVTPLSAKAEETTQDGLTYPNISSRYAYLMDMDTDQVLWSKAGEERMYPASMTKIMTIILGLDYLHDLDMQVRITRDMWMGLLDEAASVAGFRIGDSPTVRDLLYGAALPSGAEACNAIATAAGGTIENFVTMMNDKAAELGMTGTHFVNPHGLHHEDHYSTCRDIAILMKYCMQNETFREILSAKEYQTGRLYTNYYGIKMKSSVWYYVNTVGHGYQIPGFLGGKTGYTVPAGRCLVSAANVNGMSLILVTGRTPGLTSHFADAKITYQWAGETFKRYTLAYEGTRIATIPVRYADPKDSEIKVTLPSDVVYDMPAGTRVDLETSFLDYASAPLEEGTELGSYKIVVEGTPVYEMVFTATKTYPRAELVNVALSLREMLQSYLFVPAAAIALFIVLLLLSLHTRRKGPRGRLPEKDAYEDEETDEFAASFRELEDIVKSRSTEDI